MNIYLKPEELDDLYFNPPTTMANGWVPTEEILKQINKASADNAVRVIIDWMENNARHWESLSFNDQCDGREPTPMITLEMPQSQFDATLKKLQSSK